MIKAVITVNKYLRKYEIKLKKFLQKLKSALNRDNILERSTLVIDYTEALIFSLVKYRKDAFRLIQS